MSQKTLGHLSALFSITIWGTTFIASKTLLSSYSPFQTMLMRFVVAYFILITLNHKFYRTNLKDEVQFLLLALFGNTLYFICENVALTYTLASNVSIIIALAPMITAVFAHFFTKDENLHKGILIGFIIAFLGVIFVVFNGTVLLKLGPIGDALSFGAAFMWAIYSILLKKNVHRFDNFYLTRRVCFYSILTTLPLVLIEHRKFPVMKVLQPKLLISLLLLGILGSALCYISWNYSTRILGIVTTNNYIYFIPFVTLISAGLLLKEPITPMGFLGSVLIFSGILVSEKYPVKVQKKELN